MSELHNNIETISAVLDILQNNALPAQKPVLRLLGDHLRLLVRCMDDGALCPPHLPSGTPTPATSLLVAYPPAADSSCMADISCTADGSCMSDSSCTAASNKNSRQVQEVGHVYQ